MERIGKQDKIRNEVIRDKMKAQNSNYYFQQKLEWHAYFNIIFGDRIPRKALE